MDIITNFILIFTITIYILLVTLINKNIGHNLLMFKF
jgi:hypothetical protein